MNLLLYYSLIFIFFTRTNRWIFSKVPFVPTNPNAGNYSGIVFPSSREKGARFVFKWIPFQYRRLI